MEWLQKKSTLLERLDNTPKIQIDGCLLRKSFSAARY